jgi:hypothetical protein
MGQLGPGLRSWEADTSSGMSPAPKRLFLVTFQIVLLYTYAMFTDDAFTFARYSTRLSEQTAQHRPVARRAALKTQLGISLG